jgi:hypothetical protein
MAEEGTKGMSEALKQAEAGMKLFAAEEEAAPDVPAATAFKDTMDAKIAALEKEAAALTGKDNKKARVEKEKEKTSIKNQKDYIDACKVVKGLAPPNGHFIKKAAAAAPPKEAALVVEEKKEEKKDDKKKEDKPKKAMESAGISPAERKELEDLKQKIIDKKTELKAAGLSGGQMNKHEEVVAMVTRMNELKEKESPGSTTTKDKKDTGKKKGKLDSAQQAMLEDKQKALDEYVESLRTEFKYSKKDIAADPEYKEMKAELDKMSK